MSTFLALTLKSSRKAASLRKGDRDPRTYVWTDRTNSKDMFVLKLEMALAYDLPFFFLGGGRGSLSARLLRKSLHSFPIPPFVPKTRGWGEIPFPRQ